MKYWPLASLFFTATIHADEPTLKLADRLERQGDEIMVCGQLYHTTTRVVLWTDPGGYDAYRVEPRFAPLETRHATRQQTKSQPPRRSTRFGLRRQGLTPAEIETGTRRRMGPADACSGSSISSSFTSMPPEPASGALRCCRTGGGSPCISCSTWTGRSTRRSMSRKRPGTRRSPTAVRSAWRLQTSGLIRSRALTRSSVRISPTRPDRSSSRAPTRPAAEPAPSVLRPSRNELVVGTIQGKQIEAIRLHSPAIRGAREARGHALQALSEDPARLPARRNGALIPHKLPDADYARYQGILGHYHVQTNKVDPGPAFQWEQFIEVHAGAAQVNDAQGREVGDVGR